MKFPIRKLPSFSQELDYLIGTDTPFASMAKKYQEKLNAVGADSAARQIILGEYRTERDVMATQIVQEYAPALAEEGDSLLNYLK